MNFLNTIHQRNYLQLIQESQIHEHDIERKSLFYIISGDKDLFEKKKYIYNFYDNCIKTNCLNSTDVDFCSSSKGLIRLGFNLYNGYTDDFTNPLWILCGLDSRNFAIAIHAINIRFNRAIKSLELACNAG